jgi:mannose-6-phosphate isomerase-like protein (cupin superfamily)
MGIRRVVTGHNGAGKAVFASDEVVEPVTSPLAPGTELYRLWGADTTLRFPDDGSLPPHHSYFPPVGGFRFGVFVVPPEGAAGAPPDGLDVEAEAAAFERAAPGLMAHMEPDNPGMHTTASVDYEYVVSGRCVLELDDGASVQLGPGDTVVQNGTRHAWRNPHDEPCVMAVVLVGANRPS